ncbi:hypothetical protein ACFWPP_17825 [Streptomyces anulatus]|uniref:hypothetical protein n=1 Tax=Streptomyces anulatus TaxID=1892 RepID=UPI003657833A
MTDKASTVSLRRWRLDGDVPILRVNAAGILAKLPGQGQADRVLAHEEEVRHLYMTAVTSRVCAMDWTTAGRIVSQPAAYGHRADFLATRFAREALNLRDSGARWCSSVMLRGAEPHDRTESRRVPAVGALRRRRLAVELCGVELNRDRLAEAVVAHPSECPLHESARLSSTPPHQRTDPSKNAPSFAMGWSRPHSCWAEAFFAYLTM